MRDKIAEICVKINGSLSLTEAIDELVLIFPPLKNEWINEKAVVLTDLGHSFLIGEIVTIEELDGIFYVAKGSNDVVQLMREHEFKYL